MKRLIASLILCLAVAPNVAWSITWQQNPSTRPSFDCNRATTEAELAICRYPPLAAKDRAIAALYPRVVAATPRARRAALARDQANFNRSRELCYQGDEERDICLGALMGVRVTQLNGWLRGGYR
jgi:uncharacterized protein